MIPRRLALVFCVCLVAALAAEGAVVHSFRLTSEGAYTAERAGRMLVDGERWRVDLDESAGPRPYDSVIGGNGRVVALNHANQTWYELESGPLLVVPTVFNFLWAQPTRVTKLRVETGEELRFRYDTRTSVVGEQVRGAISGTMRIETREGTTAMQPLLLLWQPATGTDDVDAKLVEWLRAANGQISQLELSVERRLAGGKPMTQIIRLTLDAPAPAEVRARDFEVPSTYVQQAPVIGVPGR